MAIMGASATQLSRLDAVQNVATGLCRGSFVPLQCHRHAAVVGLLLKIVRLLLSQTTSDFLSYLFQFKFDIV